ncbi:MAG: hypothetical protein N2376_01340 [Clostridia bacterium]|nr:hypothetical protein [Clostridia bacterium]
MAHQECARCHRLFERVAFEEVCPVCLPIEEEEFGKIKEYLMCHQGASSTEVMTETGASLKSIKRYLREDRLQIVGDNKGFIKCDVCGKPINSGRYCDACYKERVSGQSTKASPSKGGFIKDSEESQKEKQKGMQFGFKRDRKG